MGDQVNTDYHLPGSLHSPIAICPTKDCPTIYLHGQAHPGWKYIPH